MVKKTQLEIYAYTYFGSISQFAYFIGITPVTLWKWINKKVRPRKNNAEKIEKLTRGVITVDYIRNKMD